VLFFSTYLGGTGDDDASNIAVDANGYAYVTGETESIDFPTTAGAFRTSAAGLKEVVVTKLDPAGSGLVYSTYLGGGSDDAGHAVAVDAAGYAYVVGNTSSTDFPTTAGAFQTTSPGRVSNTLVPFVTKLDPAGSALAYSTYLGGSTDGQAISIAVDGAGNAYVTGLTSSTDFPTTAGAFQTTRAGGTDAFVTELNPSGSALVYSTYLGGGGDDHGRDIAVDAAGHAYVIGRTLSGDFPTTPGAFQPTKASNPTSHAAFVTKLSPEGSALVYSTYLGGTGSDRGVAIALDALPDPHAYVAGRAKSTNFPTTPGAFQTTSAGLLDGWVAELDPSGSALVYSTYLGGSGDDEHEGIAVGADGSVYVAGTTKSADFPITAGAVQPITGGLAEVFVAKLDPSGSTLAYSTYLGGAVDDDNTGLALDPVGSVYVTGKTSSTDFPTTAGAFDTTFNGPDDMIVVKLADFGRPATLALAADTATSVAGTQYCVPAEVRDAAANPVPGVPVRFSVTGAHSTGGSARTDATGQAVFCYTGTQAGEDTITAVADANDNGVQDPGDPSDTATKTWVPA
jgi:hypothetical protein